MGISQGLGIHGGLLNRVISQIFPRWSWCWWQPWPWWPWWWVLRRWRWSRRSARSSVRVAQFWRGPPAWQVWTKTHSVDVVTCVPDLKERNVTFTLTDLSTAAVEMVWHVRKSRVEPSASVCGRRSSVELTTKLTLTCVSWWAAQ